MKRKAGKGEAGDEKKRRKQSAQATKSKEKDDKLEKSKEEEEEENAEIMEDMLHFYSEMKKISCIIEGLLYVGGQHSASDETLLRKLQIRHVVNAANELPNFFEKEAEEAGVCHRHGLQIKYLKFHLRDADEGEDIIPTLMTEEFKSFVDNAMEKKEACLIHCGSGISRAPTLTMAYLMRSRGLSLQAAHQMLKDKRPFILPNPNYAQQLCTLEHMIHQKNTMQPIDFGDVDDEEEEDSGDEEDDEEEEEDEKEEEESDDEGGE